MKPLTRRLKKGPCWDLSTQTDVAENRAQRSRFLKTQSHMENRKETHGLTDCFGLASHNALLCARYCCGMLV